MARLLVADANDPAGRAITLLQLKTSSVRIHQKAIWFTALVTLALAQNVFAWTDEGHQTVGAIADSLIKGHAAQQQVQQLLGTETLSVASTWADQVKGWGEQTDEMEQFRNDNPHHGQSHYTDIPFEESVYSEKSVGATNVDIVHAISACIVILQGKPEQQTLFHNVSPKIALRLLVHYVGDIHQPLHVGAGYLNGTTWVDPNTFKGPHEDDQGGNRLMWHREKLHLFWDLHAVKTAMTNANASTPQQYAGALLKRPEPQWKTSGGLPAAPTEWATQSLRASKPIHEQLKVISHKEVQDKRRGPHGEWQIEPKDDSYRAFAAKLVDQQILLGGYRLANVLETIWPDAKK
jgi:hypothetical protein